jgi:hypothetical protein
MLEFMNIDRGYQTARKTYKFACPEGFNFAFDILDAHGEDADKRALISVSADGSEISELTYRHSRGGCDATRCV